MPRPEDVPQLAVRGQYGPGAVKGKPVIGYRDTEGVDPHSQTDTFAAMQFAVDTWRWGGVPFCLRSGKAMAAPSWEKAARMSGAGNAVSAMRRPRSNARWLSSAARRASLAAA